MENKGFFTVDMNENNFTCCVVCRTQYSDDVSGENVMCWCHELGDAIQIARALERVDRLALEPRFIKHEYIVARILETE